MEKNIKLEDLNIILVEPSTMQCKMITDQLHGLGANKVKAYSDGKKALAGMLNDFPDLVISSMYLPDMTGTDLVQAMRANQKLESIAFMLISSETSFHSLDPVRQAGVMAILPKPFETEQLQKALYTTLDFLEPQNIELEDGFVEDLNVLVVDDSLTARNHIKKTLRGIGVENITEAKNGREAMELVKSNFFDLIVTDYNMPEMDGKALVDFVRNESDQAGIPILMVTSESDASQVAAVQQAGVSAMCDKPFEIGNVRELIRQIMA